jgi:flavin-dependent dehydrogenase
MRKQKIVVVGGGLAGLTASICLVENSNAEVILIEKRSYPFHRVCGEYISMEVFPFLKRMDLLPKDINTPNLTHFELSDIKGNLSRVNLPLGGFGISRYTLDNHLYKEAAKRGVKVMCEEEVSDIKFQAEENNFTIDLKSGKELTADFVIASYGKREKLDKKLDRQFINKRSPFIGVKEHVKLDYPNDKIGLYNFKLGYCGVSQVENGITNICYLSRRENLQKSGSIPEMEEKIIFENPLLRDVYTNSERLWEKPLVINEISFERKKAIENHILMAGDTAGLITPLCGNGMAMAIHSGYMAAKSITEYTEGKLNTRTEVEKHYKSNWNKNFSKRLWVGRKTQNLFGNQTRSKFSVQLLKNFPGVAGKLISMTHGQPF